MSRHPLLVLALTVAMMSLSCGGSGSSPSAPSSTSSSRTLPVSVFFSGAPFSATVEGRTVSADGLVTFDMTPGDHEISGTFSSGLLVLAFGGRTNAGGVRSGSLQSVAGSGPLVQACAIGWGDFTPRQGQVFRVRFTVVTDSLAACQ